MDQTAVKALIQRALNLMETASCWERKAAKRAHIVGLQGEKRRLRWLYRQSKHIVDWLEHYAYDHLKLDICAQPGSADVSGLVCAMSTMNGIIEKLWTIRNECHKLANELVVAYARKYSKCLYEYADTLDDILAELQRNASEYEKAQYDYHHISRYQVSWYNIHDEYEKKEESQGYIDHK